MDNKELLLSGKSGLSPTHQLTIGHIYMDAILYPYDFYGYDGVTDTKYQTQVVGNLVPAMVDDITIHVLGIVEAKGNYEQSGVHTGDILASSDFGPAGTLEKYFDELKVFTEDGLFLMGLKWGMTSVGSEGYILNMSQAEKTASLAFAKANVNKTINVAIQTVWGGGS